MPTILAISSRLLPGYVSGELPVRVTAPLDRNTPEPPYFRRAGGRRTDTDEFTAAFYRGSPGSLFRGSPAGRPQREVPH
jgi:hypothetical protein